MTGMKLSNNKVLTLSVEQDNGFLGRIKSPGWEVLMTCFSFLTKQTQRLWRTEPRHYASLQLPHLCILQPAILQPVWNPHWASKNNISKSTFGQLNEVWALMLFGRRFYGGCSIRYKHFSSYKLRNRNILKFLSYFSFSQMTECCTMLCYQCIERSKLDWVAFAAVFHTAV